MLAAFSVCGGYFRPAVRRIATGKKTRAQARMTAAVSTARTGSTASVVKLESGVTLVWYNAPGPICSATIAIATTPVSDAGHPHCLEHLVFMGSEKFPFKGYLDMLAIRSYSDGTNAWTCEDHTAYTISTAGPDGLLQVLPAYLDHVLNPVFTAEHFQQEIYHVREDGEEAGVVYQEMRGREKTEGDMVSAAWRRAIFRDTYLAYESGGRTGDIARLKMDEVRAFHRDNYCPANMTIFLVGGEELDLSKVVSAIQPALERRINGPVEGARRSPMQIPSLPERVEELVEFPSQDEEVGSVTLAWLGPPLKDIATIVAIEALLRFLTENEASPLNRRFVEIENPMASTVDFSVDLFPTSVLLFYFSGVPNGTADDDDDDEEAEEEEEEDDEDREDDEDEGEDASLESDNENGSTISNPGAEGPDENLLDPGVFSGLVSKELAEIAEKGLPGGIEAMGETIRRYRRNLLLEIENDPHNYVVDALIPDVIHDGGLRVGERIAAELEVLEALKGEGEEFWLTLLRKWLVDNKSRVCIRAVPSAKLAEELDQEKAQTVNSKTGAAKEMPDADAAKSEKSTTATPGADLMPAALPDTSNIGRIPCSVVRVSDHVQVTEVDSEFSSISIVVDASHLDVEKRKLLTLLSELVFCVDVDEKRGAGAIPYPTVVRELTEAAVHTSVGVGRNASTFRAGVVPESLVIDVGSEAGREEEALELALRSIFHAKFTPERVTSVLNNLHSDVRDALRDGGSVLRAITTLKVQDRRGRQESNEALLTIIHQRETIEELLEMSAEQVAKNLGELRDLLVLNATPFVHGGGRRAREIADMARAAWHRRGGGCDTSAINPFRLRRPTLPEGGTVQGAKDHSVLVPIGGVQSAYCQFLVDCPVHHEHEDMFALEVLCEFLARVEGPLYSAIRGAGLAYGVWLAVNLNQGQLVLSIDDTANPADAWNAAVEVLDGFLNQDDWAPSRMELDAAKAAVLYQMHGSRMTPSHAVDYAFGAAARGQVANDEHFDRKTRLLDSVDGPDLRRVLSKYVSRLFQSQERLVIVTSGPAAAEAIKKGFAESKYPTDLHIEPLKWDTEDLELDE